MGRGDNPLTCLPAASRSRRSGCRLSGAPARSCPKPTTTTSGEPGARRTRGGDGEGGIPIHRHGLALLSRYLIKFLAKLTEYQDTNKMTPSNVAIVLGPNLLWPQADG